MFPQSTLLHPSATTRRAGTCVSGDSARGSLLPLLLSAEASGASRAGIGQARHANYGAIGAVAPGRRHPPPRAPKTHPHAP